jgi:N-sulfoglucosamine sulfohydrolase
MQTRRPPNIIYIHSHDTGRWCEPYWNAVPTPHLAAFARTATVFDNAHTASPTCSPSRGCLLTGTYPHQHGLTGLAQLGFDLERPEWHLAHHLRNQGYQTVLSGVQHERHSIKPDVLEFLGYERDISSSDHSEGVLRMDLKHAENAAAFLASEDSCAKPFFLSVGFFNTHRPYHDVPPWTGPLPRELPDTPAARADFAGYADSLQLLDTAFGTVTDALEVSPHRENTIVLFTTDHGPPYPDMKCTAHGAGTGVALFIRDPSRQTQPSSKALVSNIDVYPTLCELAGLPCPDHVEGQSLVPLMTGKTDSVRDEAFTQINFHVAPDPVRAIRTRDFLFIQAFPPEPERNRIANIDNGPHKQHLLEIDKLPLQRETVHLYDLREDPYEQVNLAGKPEYRKICDHLRKRIEAWMRETKDPLLDGTMPMPEDALQVDIHSLDPRDIQKVNAVS